MVIVAVVTDSEYKLLLEKHNKPVQKKEKRIFLIHQGSSLGYFHNAQDESCRARV